MFVCDGFYTMVFIRWFLCNAVYENCLYNNFSYELLACDSFMTEFRGYVVGFKIIFSMKKWVVKVFSGLKVYFFNVILSVIIFYYEGDHRGV